MDYGPFVKLLRRNFDGDRGDSLPHNFHIPRPQFTVVRSWVGTKIIQAILKTFDMWGRRVRDALIRNVYTILS